jgi:hypothetical protein
VLQPTHLASGVGVVLVGLVCHMNELAKLSLVIRGRQGGG